MHGFFVGLSRLMAYLGGAVLATLVVLTCLSIAGRSLNGLLHSDLAESVAPALAAALLDLGIGPVNGDFELVEAGMAFAIFAFLPLCQISGAHASVDIFTARLGRRANRVLLWISEMLFAGVLVLIAVQLGAGMMGKLRTGQTTFLLEFPVWWAYALSLSGAVSAAAVAVYMAAMRSVEMATGRDLLPHVQGAGH
ncbi:TRAP transporter small permease [Thalassococcus sp. CAU 1522]|uniref:TRAP transporter small permease protein n=1 Tax=Thalassococcus arenae TaxID=2851652 RepID=A0ABS6N3E2_9RHOB|nr:TRAP transporter small permease [Thalassococcus arenae]MBV2358536.1 TRAP transporter small permease [Thalassococcus arenae]